MQQPFQQQQARGEFDRVSWFHQQQQSVVYSSADGFQQQPRRLQLAAGSTGGAGGQVSGGVFVGETEGGAAAGSFGMYVPIKAPT